MKSFHTNVIAGNICIFVVVVFLLPLFLLLLLQKRKVAIQPTFHRQQLCAPSMCSFGYITNVIAGNICIFVVVVVFLLPLFRLLLPQNVR